jgi:membrane-bound lytic murein transglycosylase B
MPLRFTSCTPSHRSPLIHFAQVLALGGLLAWGTLSPTAAAASKARKATPTQKVAQKKKASTAPTYGNHVAALQFAQDVAQDRGLDPAWTRKWVSAAVQIPAAQRLVAPAPTGTAKNWTAYRARFVEPKRLDAGVRFWQTHRSALERAEKQYGVPAELVVGIIGVETLYGQHTGQFRVLDVLATLAFDFPQNHPRAAERSAFFRGELAQHLVNAWQQQATPERALGSFAGAMGLPQFMPSSWARFAVDFDGDGRIDLLNSPQDAIGSVANYLLQFGWKPGMPTHYPVNLRPDADMATLLAPDILPTFSPERFQALGAELSGTAQQHAGNLALVELQNGDPNAGGIPPTHWAGTENFYVVTRYNWSSYYALAVIDLGNTIKEQITSGSKPRTDPP